MRKHNEITISGVDFEFLGGTDRRVTSRRTLDDCYGSCSQYKRSAWNYWVEWFNKIGGIYTISSYNSNFFSIQGEIKMGDIEYFIEITYAHHRIWMINK